MIHVGSDRGLVTLQVTDISSPSLFASVKGTVKLAGFRWDDKKRVWKSSVYRFDEIRDSLEEKDIVKIQDERILQDLREGQPELKLSNERIIPDYELLHYPPIEGKHPYEKFQRIDIGSGLTRNRYGYFLGMGTGKSYIFSALIAHYMIKWGKVSKILLVSTNIGTPNVTSELKKFIKGFDQLRTTVGGVNDRTPFRDDVDIVICSYNSFRVICNQYKKEQKLTATKPRKPFLPLKEWFGDGEGMLILDESHEVANPASLQGHLMALHSDLFEYRYLFTGTPADKPEKLYNQLKIIDPALTHRMIYTEWLSTYAHLGDRFSSYSIREWKFDKLEELNKRFTSKYGIYRETQDVIDLPPHYMKRVPLDMKPNHRDIYEEFVISTLEEANHLGRNSNRDIVNMFPYMLLAVENPNLLEKHFEKLPGKLVKAVEKFRYDRDHEKVSFTKDVLEDHKGEKGILWVVHPVTANTLAETFIERNPLIVTGETPKSEREEILDRFRNTDDHNLLIANINVLNTSVTLIECTFQVYVERIFAYSAYEQSTMRIHRIGQENTVITYIPIFDYSLDVLLDENLRTKESLVKGLLAKEFITQQEWVSIFNKNLSLT